MRQSPTPDAAEHAAPTLTLAIRAALDAAGDGALDRLGWTAAADLRDVLLALLELHDLWLAPVDRLGSRAAAGAHPSVLRLKNELEVVVRARFDALVDADPSGAVLDVEDERDAVAAMRRLAASELVPPVYEWLAERATYEELVEFLTLEGGPDAGFDDLVALCQVGLRGVPKVALALNYWDEMGRGDPAAVHTVLHERLVDAIDMSHRPRDVLPVEALERSVLGGYLATNRVLQPELLGALGLLELQAGPRCRKVVRALERLDAPRGALPFYEEHARADPVHGRDWLERAVGPLARDVPGWAPRIVRGARWRAAVNGRFFAAMQRRFTSGD